MSKRRVEEQDVIVDEVLGFYHSEMSNDQVREALFLVIGHLGMQLRRTNRTKHGDMQMLLEKEEP